VNAPHPDDLIATLRSFDDDLPVLIGPDPDDQKHVETYRAAGDTDAAAKLWERLQDFAAARDKIEPILAARAAIRQELADRGGEEFAAAVLAAVSEVEVEPGEPEPTRGITLKTGGVGGARSFKLRNLRYNWAEAGEVTFHSIVLCSHLSPSFLSVVEALLLLHSGSKALTVHFGEYEAGVLYGLIALTANKTPATLADIITATNAGRAKAKPKPLGAIAAADFEGLLQTLAAAGSVEKVPGAPPRWKIIEKFKVK
jgi:hypothetical protein